MPVLFIATLVVCLPLVYLNTTLDPTQPLRFLILSIVLVILSGTLLTRLYLNRSKHVWSVLRRLIFPVCGIYVLLCATSVLQAINVADAIYDLAKVLLAIVLFVCATLVLASDKQGVKLLTKAMVISGMILSAIGVCQYYGIAFTSIPGNVIPYGTMANKNLLASIICLALPFGLYATLRFERAWSIVGLLEVMLSLWVILIGQTRASWVALLLAATVVVPLYIIWLSRSGLSAAAISRDRKKIAAVALIALLIVIGAVSGIILRKGQGSIGDRVTSIITHQDPSSQERLSTWSRSWQLFTQHPLLGVGIGNWKIACPGLGTPGRRSETADIYFMQPHNDYLWVLTETGILGLAAYLLIYILAIWYAVRVLLRRASPDEAVFVLLMLFAMICFSVDSFFHYPRERVELLTFSTLILAAIVSTYHRLQISPKELPRNIVAAALIVCLLSAIAGAVVGVIRLGGETHVKSMWNAKGAGNWSEVIRQADLARSPWLTLDPTATPLLWYRGVAKISLNETEQACRDFTLAYRDHPNHPHVLNNLGTCAELEGDHNQAIDYYNQAVRITPRFDDAWLNLTAVYFNRGEYIRADSALSHVDSTCHDTRAPALRLSIAEKLQAAPTKWISP
jgi:O-antigen ligase